MMSFHLKIKHNGVEIEFTAEDIQQVTKQVMAIAKPPKVTEIKRGRPKGAKSKIQSIQPLAA
jgi:ribosomal protein L10